MGKNWDTNEQILSQYLNVEHNLVDTYIDGMWFLKEWCARIQAIQNKDQRTITK
jgi:hypothetical protein